MFRANVFLFILTTLFTTITLAYEPKEGNVAASFGPTMYKPQFEPKGTNVPSAVRTGFGLSVQGDLGPKSNIEIGLFHLYKNYLIEKSNGFLEEETEVIQINVGYRRWFSSVFSAGLFLSSLYSLGDPQITHTDFTVADTPSTSARETAKYAGELSLQTEIYKNENRFINLDLRYLYLLSPKADEQGNHYGIFFSFNFLILEKKQ